MRATGEFVTSIIGTFIVIVTNESRSTATAIVAQIIFCACVPIVAIAVGRNVGTRTVLTGINSTFVVVVALNEGNSGTGSIRAETFFGARFTIFALGRIFDVFEDAIS